MLSMMPITLLMGGAGGLRIIGVSNSTLNAQQATVPVNAVSGVIAGDLMIAIMSCRGPTTWSGDTGWTEALDNPSFAPSLRVAYKYATGSEPSSYTFTVASAAYRPVAQIIAIRGGLWDTIGSLAGDSGGDIVSTGITADGGLLLASYSTISTVVPGGNTFTTPTGMTDTPKAKNEPISGEMMSLQTFYQRIPSGATGTRTTTIGGATNGGAGVLIGVKRA